MRCARLLSCLGFAALSAAGADGPVRFNRDIRTIMSDTCFRCHGPDRNSRMAGLRLDQREAALKPTPSGAIPIVPGDPDKSAIVQRVFSDNPKRLMPPAYSHKELTAAQKELIRRWVAEGARFEGHWAFEPVRRPTPPASAGNPIDAFISARLAQSGLRLSPEAGKRTLLRRVTLDLTGLPPTPSEMSAFLADSSPDAYEKAVGRLLASPRHAELQAMRWLDAVRYGDSSGFHGDNLWPAWPYRDYVLRAFRDNKPFDEFTREQLAGDLLANATLEQKIASAYNRMNRVSAEGGLQPKEYLAKYGADRVRTVSTVWLGATMGCAECHDHKFDPFLQKDFYSMKAFFADIKETGLVPDRGTSAWGSKLTLPTGEQSRRLKALDERLEAAKKQVESRAAELAARRAAWEKELIENHRTGKLAWQYQRPVGASALQAKLTVYNDEPVESNFYIVNRMGATLASDRKRGDGIVIASGPSPDREVYTVRLKPGAGTWTALAIDVLQDESLPGSRIARGADRFMLSEVEAETAEGSATRRHSFSLATSTMFGTLPENAPAAAIDGNPKTAWGPSYGEGRNQMIALRFASPVTTAADTVLTVRLRHESDVRRATIGRFRVALSKARYSWPESGESGPKAAAAAPGVATLNIAIDRGVPADVLKAMETPEAQRTAEQRKAIVDHMAWTAQEFEPLLKQAAAVELERALLDAEIPRVLYTEVTEPRETRVLPRGNFLDDSGAVVDPAVPASLGKLAVAGKRASRLDLAKWLVSPDNPLTARTFVNRTWRQFFGTGLSKVLEDLGSQGEWPTHPELIDWLAAEFMSPSWNGAGAHPWDMRHLTRTIVLSKTYRQSSESTPELNEKDPDNRLLARQSRFRVDAEVVHDVALAVSGLLEERFGGPSVKPPQPEGYLGAMNFPKREYAASVGKDQYRRGLYTQWQRTFLHPSLSAFDAPSREECTVNRVNSNTPLQALVLLNDPIYVEAARVFAARALRSGGAGLDRQIDWVFQQSLNRDPKEAERKILSVLYRKNLARFQTDRAAAEQLLGVGESPRPAGANPAELAAMTTVTRAVLNLHETITRN